MDHWLVAVVRALTSPKVPVTTVALIVFGVVMVQIAPPGYERTAVVGGTFGFSVFAMYAHARFVNPTLPAPQRGPIMIAVLLILAVLMVIQVRAILAVVRAWIDRPPPTRCELLLRAATPAIGQPQEVRAREVKTAQERLRVFLARDATVSSGVQHPGNIGPYFVAWNPLDCASESTTYRSTIFAADPDRDPLTFRLIDSPPGMRLDVVATEVGTVTMAAAIIEWQPRSEQVRLEPYTATVEVTDSHPDDPGHTISRTFQVTVVD